MRVQIPAYTDRWMMGDRYGDVVKTSKAWTDIGPGPFGKKDIAHVKLDKSRRIVRVILDDCEVL